MVAGPEDDSLAPSAMAIGSSAANKILSAAGRLQVELAFSGEEALPPGIALTGPDSVVTVEAAGEEAQLLHGDLITVVGGDGHDGFVGLGIAQPLLQVAIEGGQCGEEVALIRRHSGWLG